MRVLFLAALLAPLAAGPPASAQTQSVVELSARPGTAFRMLLVEPVSRPHAAVLLFNGGTGTIRLAGTSDTPLEKRYARGNFLLRVRAQFAAQGLRVGALDVPSDRAGGMPATFRRSAEHAADVAAAVERLRGPERVPVWLVGTSMGTVSAAAVAVRLGAGIDGLVLTSSMTRPVQNGPNWLPEPGGIRDFRLADVKVPVLVMSHADDECWATPPADAKSLAGRFAASPRVRATLIEGGLPQESDDCESLAPHGYWGAERAAVDAIANFVAGR